MKKRYLKACFIFNRYMKQLKSYEIEMGEAGTSMEEEDVVKIMTIHKRQGVRIPGSVCKRLVIKNLIVLDLNKASFFASGTWHRNGMCEYNTTVHHPSLMKKAIQEKVWKDTLEEEMRILYVAMTRAKRKLITYRVIKSEELEAGMRASIQRKMACRKYDGLDSSGYGRTISKYR